MHYDEFIRRVQEEAGLATEDDAVDLTEATLATLGERLYRTEREDLAAQLPNELQSMFTDETPARTSRSDVHPFNLEDFYLRVSARTDESVTDVIPQAQAVMRVLNAAVSDGAWSSLQSQLPPDYNELFGGASPGVAHRRTDGTYEVNPQNQV